MRAIVSAMSVSASTVAGAAHVDADILIVDEILSVGDAAFNQNCMRRIAEFKKGGGTLLFVSHDLGAITNLCERVVWLEEGHVREIGSPQSICHHYHASIGGEVNRTASFSFAGRSRSSSSQASAVATPVAERHRAAIAPPRDVEVFSFNPVAPWFGGPGASIAAVRLQSTNGGDSAVLSGGEEVVLEIDCLAHCDIRQGVVGFSVKDRLGQLLFGDNTYLTHRHWSVAADQSFRASFPCTLPFLATGDYAVLTTITEGDQQPHRHHHEIDEAMFFRVHTSHVQRGFIGIPMNEIQLAVLHLAAASEAFHSHRGPLAPPTLPGSESGS